MWFALSTVLTVGLGALAAWQLNIARVFDVFQPIIVCLSIMAAAVFVRLNRGMPTLDWKSLATVERKNLTGRIVELTRNYTQIVALNGFTLIAVILLSAAGKIEILALPDNYKQGIAGIFIFLISQCVVRMAYVVWRDYDIVRLQKDLLDKAADRDAVESDKKAADDKIAAIKSANLRPNTMTRVGGS